MTLCPALDPFCPCQDGDACHYDDGRMTPPTEDYLRLCAVVTAAGPTDWHKQEAARIWAAADRVRDRLAAREEDERHER
jgi:hypothetical protein